MSADMEWIAQHFQPIDRFPRPDWQAIYTEVEQHYQAHDQHRLWCNIATVWMQGLKTELPTNYALHESKHFMLLTAEPKRYVSLFLEFLERCHKSILNILPGIASDNGFGKHIVIIFDDMDDYYAYLSHFYPDDGVYGLSTGIHINQGYGHFAFPATELTYAESTSAHEMTHALLSHLPIPAWLNEGIAVSVEDMITHNAPLRMEQDLYLRHQKFWQNDRIQAFWSGDAFHRADEGQELSYHLAQFAVSALSKDYESFVPFVNQAHYADAGEAAAQDVYGGSLGDLIAQFFGDGDWKPTPEMWSKGMRK